MRYTWILVVAVGVFCLQAVHAQEQITNKIQLPTTPHTNDVVSLELASKIAARKIENRFGEAVTGDPIIGYDLDGNAKAYIIPFCINSKMFPLEQEIFEGMNEARRLLPDAKRELAKVRELSLKMRKAAFMKVGGLQCLEKNIEWQQAEEKVTELKNRCWGIGDYGYVVVSARKDLVPILEFSNTLPYYYTYKRLAEGMAQESLASTMVYLTRFYYGSSMDQIFEFQSPEGKKIWVALFPIRVTNPGEITTKALEITAEEKEWIKEKWNIVTAEVQNDK